MIKSTMIFVFSKTGKTLVKKNDEDTFLFNESEVKKLIQQISPVSERCIFNLEMADILTCEYIALITDDETEVKGYVWCDDKNEIFFNEEISFSINVDLLIKGEKRFIKFTDKESNISVECLTPGEMVRYIGEYDGFIGMKGVSKKYALIVVDEAGRVYRSRYNKNEFREKRFLEYRLKALGFEILKRVDADFEDEKHYCLVKVNAASRKSGSVYYWDKPTQIEEKLLKEHGFDYIKTEEC